MSAMSVLYRNIFKFPHRMSARADVEHIRAGKIHFERHARSSDISPSLDKLIQAMLASAEDLTSETPALDTSLNTITVAEPS